jgi:hypothetical protein
MLLSFGLVHSSMVLERKNFAYFENDGEWLEWLDAAGFDKGDST